MRLKEVKKFLEKLNQDEIKFDTHDLKVISAWNSNRKWQKKLKQ